MKEAIDNLMTKIAELKEEKKNLEGAEELVILGRIIGLQEAVLALMDKEYDI